MKRNLIYIRREYHKGKKPAHVGIFNASNNNYQSLDVTLSDSASKSSVGFLAVVPVPFDENYTSGKDRHPFILIKKYIDTVSTLDPKRKNKKYSFSDALVLQEKD